MTQVHRYLKNALLLVGASLFMRGISLLFNGYVTQQIGAEGMGLFTLIMSVYGFAVTFATSGIGLAVTRLCAEAMGKGEDGAVRGIIRRAVLHAVFFGGIASLFLFFFADQIGTGLLGDGRTIPSLRLLSCSMVPIALSAVFSGYFQAVRRVERNAATALFEQGVRMVLTVYGLLALLPSGLTYACLALVGGSSLAEFCSFFFIYLQYRLDRRKHARGLPPHPGRGLTGRLLRVSMPVAISAYVRSGLVTVEHILIPLCLAGVAGGRSEALASYGVLHGMALPIILFPTAISSAFSGLLVPEMAEARARGEEGHIRYMAERAIGYTLLFSFLCAGVLCACAGPLGRLLYGSEEAGRFIRLLAPVVVIMYVDTTVDSILKGLGHQVFTMGVNIADSLLSILLVCLLLPRMGAVGYVYVIILAEVFNFSLSAARLHSAIHFRFSFYRRGVAPFLATLGGAAIWRLVWRGGDTPLSLCLSILLILALYLFLLFCLSAFPQEERRWLHGLLPSRPKRHPTP